MRVQSRIKALFRSRGGQVGGTSVNDRAKREAWIGQLASQPTIAAGASARYTPHKMTDRRAAMSDEVARAFALLASLDADLVTAAGEVDRTLIRESLARTPTERMAWALRGADELDALTGGSWRSR